MSNAFIKSLPNVAKKWAANAVAGIISADGIITEKETELLREVISFLENIQDINEIIATVKNRQKPELKVLKTDRKTASKLLMTLAMVALTDDNLTGAEAEYFRYIGNRLGFDRNFSEEIIKWGQDYIVLNNRKKSLMKKAEELSPVYHSI